MKYLLIDGNNLAVRSAFANQDLKNNSGIPTGVHFGFFQSLVNLKSRFPDSQFLIVWDGKSKRRVAEAKEGIEKGLIKSGYKENRTDPEQPLLDFYAQAPYLKKGLEQTGIPQIRIPEYEADDLIASYCKKLGKNNEITCVTNDKDYYQLVSDNIKISKWHSGEEIVITKDKLIKENGITPKQFIDMGALWGDTSDNIFGVPGWGEKTSLEAIKEHGSWEAVITHLKEIYLPIREKYPDVKGVEFEKLRNIRTPKEEEKFKKEEEWKGKYPEIKEWMSYTGVALAFEEKKWKPNKDLKKGLKTNLLALMFEERIRLAYSLKKMDDDIQNLPEFKQGKLNKDKLIEYFDYYNIETLKEDIPILE